MKAFIENENCTCQILNMKAVEMGAAMLIFYYNNELMRIRLEFFEQKYFALSLTVLRAKMSIRKLSIAD